MLEGSLSFQQQSMDPRSPLEAVPGGARRHEEGSGRRPPSGGRRLVQSPTIAVPVSAPPALSWPQDGELGANSIILSLPGTAAVQLAQPAPSLDIAAALAVPGLTASHGQATENRTSLRCAQLLRWLSPWAA